MISKYRNFPLNIDSLGIAAKNNFFKVISKDRHFPLNIDGLGIAAKNNFLGNQFFKFLGKN